MKFLKALILVFFFGLLHAAEWSFELPPTQYYQTEVDADWREVDSLGLTVQLVGEVAENSLLLAFYLQTEEGHWIESREDLKLNGELQRFELSLAEDSIDWRMSNGDRVFGKDLLRRVKVWGLRLYSPEPVGGVIRIGDLDLSRKQQSQFALIPPALPAKIEAGLLFPLECEPREWTADLYDPKQTPTFEIRQGDERIMLPTVWVQKYNRRTAPGKLQANSVLWERPVFRALWMPQTLGEVELFLHYPDGKRESIRVGKVEVTTESYPLHAIEVATPPVDLDFWQGMSGSSTVWQKRTMDHPWEQAELTGVWTPRLDWTDAWGTYAGLGDFSQPRASAFEAWMLASDQKGALRVVTENILNNRSQFNWQDHPWNLVNGGDVLDSFILWGEQRWQDLIVRRAVYLWHRYGAYSQATGLYIDVSRASAYHVAWINALTTRLQLELPGVDIFCPSPGLPTRELTGELEIGNQGWQKPDQLFGAENFVYSAEEPGEVVLVGASDQGFDAAISKMQHWSTREVLQLDVEAQFSEGVVPMIQLHVRTSPERVFASPLIELHNRERNRVFLDIHNADVWNCFQDPSRKWTPLERMNIREVVLRVYADKPDPDASFKIVSMQTVTPPLGSKDAEVPLAISNLQIPANKVKTLERQEWVFDLNRFFQNPYNPEEIAVDLEVTLPTGEQVSHPGFFNQKTKRVYKNGIESWQLENAYDWRVRFRPWLAGPHAWRLVVRYQPVGETEPVQLVKSGEFEASKSGNPRGFIQQSKKDPHYFEFQNGEFFYPLGHTMRSPTDRRSGIYEKEVRESLDIADAKGTVTFEDWFRRMHDNGGNFGRVWVSNWWLGLEWNSRHTGYHGRKYFNQLNAARLDRLIRLAEENEIYLNLETTNHGTFSSSVDNEWDENPWSAFSPDEGPIPYASEFVTHEEAKQWHQYKMRYLIARIGDSPAIAFWGVLTETEWTEAYFRSMKNIREDKLKPYHPNPYKDNSFRDPLKQWTQETALFFKQANGHPTLSSTHFSNPNNGRDFWRLPDVSVVYNNAYSRFFSRERPELPEVDRKKVGGVYPEFESRRDPFYKGIVREIYGYCEFFRNSAKDDKILLVGEWGGSPSQNKDSHLIAEFHSGLWASMVTELSGVGGFWWFNLVAYHDLFDQYAAASKFMDGEDLRGKNFKQSRWPIRFVKSNRKGLSMRQAIGKSTGEEAMGYIYSVGLSDARNSQPPKSFDDKSYPESGPGWLYAPAALKNGQYQVEYWNTFTGEIIERRSVFIHPENREVPIPNHRVDLAVKLKFVKKLPPPTPTPLPPTPTPLPPTPTPLPPPPPTPVPLPVPTLMPTPMPTPQILSPQPPPDHS